MSQARRRLAAWPHRFENCHHGSTGSGVALVWLAAEMAHLNRPEREAVERIVDEMPRPED